MGLLDKVFGNDDEERKKRADFSNVQSGGSSTAPRATPPNAATSASRPADVERTYTVVAGDSLSKIAKREYGDAGAWRRIYDANRDIVKDPDLIHPGQRLRIPSIELEGGL
jgi:nucleoid-associated protein YgaU